MALVVEVAFLPVKARTRLVESLTAAVRQIREMETCIAAGIEEGVKLDVYDPKVLRRVERASAKANGALAAAETFRKLDKVSNCNTNADVVEVPFCSNEPRIKGSFKGLSLIYGEVSQTRETEQKNLTTPDPFRAPSDCRSDGKHASVADSLWIWSA